MGKKLLGLFVVFMMVIGVLAGCGGKSKTEGQAAPPTPKNPNLILATTTSTQDSGLLDVLIPDFEKKTGYKVKTIAVGTGEALKMAQKGEADVVLVHAPKSEQPLVDNKDIVDYHLVMHNDFVIVGPENDPAGIKGSTTAADAFKKIADTKSLFVSRGDDSGTNKKELDIWKTAGITPAGQWYQESGSGMGQTLQIASEKNGYTLTDRATYLAQKANLHLVILMEGEKSLLNIYHVAQVNPEKFNKVNAEGAKAFVDYMIAPDTQKLIGEFGKDKFGQALFSPDAGKSEKDL